MLLHFTILVPEWLGAIILMIHILLMAIQKDPIFLRNIGGRKFWENVLYTKILHLFIETCRPPLQLCFLWDLRIRQGNASILPLYSQYFTV